MTVIKVVWIKLVRTIFEEKVFRDLNVYSQYEEEGSYARDYHGSHCHKRRKHEKNHIL